MERAEVLRAASATTCRPSWRWTHPDQDDTRFKEDLEADSLDLVELVRELEDSYGIRIPDEEAAGILTVGQAADYVAAPCRRSVRRLARVSSTQLPDTLGGRCSRTPRGWSTAPTPTSGWRSSATASSAWRSPPTSSRASRGSARAA